MKLAQRLDCFPPAFVGRPFSHLEEMMELVADFDPPGQTAQLRVTARDWITDAIARYEEGAEPTLAEQDAEQRRIQHSAVAALTEFLAGDYAKTSEIAAGALGKATRVVDTWAHLMEGNALSGQAKTKSGTEADELFAAAGEKYQRALATKPDDHKALHNWGTTLFDQAETKSGAEVEELYRLAAEKLSRAEVLAPGYAAYNLARPAAVQGREDEALAWLVKAREAGTLPGHAHLDRDPDLDTIRASDRFQDFLAGLEA